MSGATVGVVMMAVLAVLAVPALLTVLAVMVSGIAVPAARRNARQPRRGGGRYRRLAVAG